MAKKPLSTGKQLLVILILSISLVMFGVNIAFTIKYIWFKNNRLLRSIIYLIVTGASSYVSLMILLKNYKRNKKKKTTMWYVDKIIAAFIPTLIMTAIVLIGIDDLVNDKLSLAIVGFIMFPCIGILVTPNIIRYALNDMKNWKDIFYKNGNLHTFKDSENFYEVKPPVPFQRKLYFAVLKDQVLNLGTVVFLLIGFVLFAMVSITHESDADYKGRIIASIIHVKAERAVGPLAFIMLFFIVFGIPIMAYYITNTVYKLRVVRRHKYIAYHAIVKEVKTYKLLIRHNGRVYKYDYCTCVGIREKKVHDTKAILVFIPDDLFLFPDKEANGK